MNKPESNENDEPDPGRNIIVRLIFIAIALFCLTPFVSPPIALFMGLMVAQFVGHPFLHYNHRFTQFLLKTSIVGLGFGMNIYSAFKAGKEGVLFTVVSIIATLVLGYFLGKFLKIENKTAYLVSTGTAICGGSAIAAVSPIIKAEQKEISVALGAVFILNSIALLVFPFIGHKIQLTQTQFGLWCAIAIHDTSSVVGAASKYGTQALEMATTVKLARALWIIPVSFISTYLFKNKDTKIKIPYFIGLFLLAMILNSCIPFIQQHSHYIVSIAKAGLTLTLFLIGAGLSKKVLQSVGAMPLLHAFILWIFISVFSLWAVISWVV